jgi:hypothetical protein
MPTASDLVTDLPADFEVFGQAVATSMADLLGGTTGQILAKASNTNMDFTWVAQDDSNAIQNAIVDAKGDLIAATAADTPARIAVGTNGQVLTADSTAATGLVWATPSAGGSTINYTQLSAATPSGSTYTVSVSSYNFYFIYIDGVTTSSGLGEYALRFNADSTSKYAWAGSRAINAPASLSISATGFNTQNKIVFMEGGNSSANDNYAAIRVEGGAGTGAKFVQATSAPTGTSGDIYIIQSAYTGASAITSISLIETNGFTFTSGTVRIYGSN